MSRTMLSLYLYIEIDNNRAIQNKYEKRATYLFKLF